MTDQTESASEYAELLADLEFYTENDYRNPLQTRPATQAVIRNALDAIRSLEAMVRSESRRAALLQTQWHLALRQAQANGKIASELRADRDRLAGEVDNERSEHHQTRSLYERLLATHTDTLNTCARLTAELAEAREDSARVDALQSTLRSVDFDFEQTGESVLMFTLPAGTRVGMNVRTTVDAARRAGGEG